MNIEHIQAEIQKRWNQLTAEDLNGLREDLEVCGLTGVEAEQTLFQIMSARQNSDAAESYVFSQFSLSLVNPNF